jgi:hypothetical protein
VWICERTRTRELRSHPSHDRLRRRQANRRPCKAEVIARADAICVAMHRVGLWQRQAHRASTLAQLVVPVRHTAALAAELLRRLDALTAPPTDRTVVNRYRELVSRQAADIAKIKEAIDAGNTAEGARLGQTNNDYIDRQLGMAAAYGLKVCGHDPSATSP